MKIEHTSRGFKIGTFKDANGQDCTVQESSAIRCDSRLIWLGAEEVDVQIMTEHGWKTVDFNAMSKDGQFVGNQRMHLSQRNVKDMLPVLTYFAEHGCLPDSEEDLLSPAEASCHSLVENTYTLFGGFFRICGQKVMYTLSTYYRDMFKKHQKIDMTHSKNHIQVVHSNTSEISYWDCA